MEERRYQVEAIDLLRNHIGAGRRAPLLVMPTGSGKTVIFSEIAKKATKKGNNVLILVHRRELIKQASRKLTDIGVEHGVIAAGFKPSKKTINVASVQTLVRRLEKIVWKPNLIIIDEAHHACAGSWDKILKHWPDAIKLGVTATPMRLDGRGLADYFDQIVLGPLIPALVKDKYLAPHRVFAPPFRADLSKIKTRGGDYAKDQLSQVMIDEAATIMGDAVEQYRKHANGLPAIAFCVDVRHANFVTDRFNKAGYRAALITGTMKMDDRDQVIDDLTTGKIQILVSIDVVSEGFDLPLVSACILLRPTKSLGLYMQQVGRILRPQPGKTAIVLDHVRNTVTHGFIDETRDWDLNSKRKKNRGEAAPGVTVCEVCFAVYPSIERTCPVCGHERPSKKKELNFMAGDLVELKREALSFRSVRRKTRARHREQAKARTLADLQALGLKRGYSPGWAYMIYNSRKPKRR